MDIKKSEYKLKRWDFKNIKSIKLGEFERWLKEQLSQSGSKQRKDYELRKVTRKSSLLWKFWSEKEKGWKKLKLLEVFSVMLNK